MRGCKEARDSISGKNVIESLADYNCNHYATPIICGISQPRYTDKELKELNEKNKKEFVIDGISKTGYEWSQAMRRLENAAKKQKTIKTAAQASGDNELVKQCNDRIKAIEKKYNTIAKETDIKAQPQKMAIVRSNNLQNGLQKNSNNGIINKKEVSIMQTGGVLDNGALNPEKEEDFEAAMEHALVFMKRLEKEKRCRNYCKKCWLV